MKKVKYSGTIEVRPGDFLVWMSDGTVQTYNEAFAGFVSEQQADELGHIMMYEPKLLEEVDE